MMDITTGSRFISMLIVLMLFYLLGCASNTQVGEDENEIELKEVRVPIAGNTYQTDPESNEQISNEGIQQWSSKETTFSTFIKVPDIDSIKVSARAKVSSGESTIRISVNGIPKQVKVGNSEYQSLSYKAFPVPKGGYVQIDLKGIEKLGANFASVTDLLVKVPESASVTYIENNENNNFYWGRRGPSVHLQHKLPSDTDIEWFYSEITVPEGEDPVGSYFMANGFLEGYFGIQVNSEQERRVLFSVWSPYDTDNPEDIPESERIQLLAKGDGVQAGKFGNEGSGGQSYWVFPWKANKTYKFLNRVAPDGDGNTINTAYFYASELGKWKLIASFKRPKTDKWMTGIYSFLENFVAGNGFMQRKAFYGNQWARDKEGNWHELTKATFTGDAIANSGYRDDFSSGTKSTKYYLQNGGFESGTVPLGSNLNREAVQSIPNISIEGLPNGQ